MVVPIHQGDWNPVAYLIGPPESRNVVLINAGVKVHLIHEKVDAKRLNIKGIVLLSGKLSEAGRAAEVAGRFGVPVWAHPNDLVDLNRLPAAGEEANLCGVKAPNIQHFLPDEGRVEIAGCSLDVLRSFLEPKGTMVRFESSVFLGNMDLMRVKKHFSGSYEVFRTSAAPERVG